MPPALQPEHVLYEQRPTRSLGHSGLRHDRFAGVTLHTDLPTTAQIDRLMADRNPASVSIYLPTEPITDGEHERIGMKNATTEAVRELEARGIDKRDIAAIEHQLDDLIDDVHLWRHAARSLAVFVTPDTMSTFRLPNHLHAETHVSDRYFTKPLLRAVTFPNMAYVLALSQHQVRLIEVLSEAASFEVDVPGMPTDVDHATASSGAPGRAPRKHLTSAEGDKLRMAQYSRRIDQALRPVLDGKAPLIVAAAEPLASIFHNACSYDQLSPEMIAGNPDTTPEGELTVHARAVLDRIYTRQLAEAAELFDQRRSQQRGLTDIAEVARAATLGMVDTVFVDIDDTVWGRIDDTTGTVTFCDATDTEAYGVIDEISRRVWAAGGKVMAVRGDEVPEGGPVAAILRYPMP